MEEQDRRVRRRRARGLPGTLGLTLLGALVPGAPLVWSGRRLVGWSVVLTTVLALVLSGWFLGRDLHTLAALLSDPARLRGVAAGAVAAVVAWACVLVAGYLAVRPERRKRWQGAVGTTFVALLCLVVAAPAALAVRYSLIQADLVHDVFQGNRSATAPQGPVTREDPWHGKGRVNVLLLGGDGGIDRQGVRTDSMILASMDTRTGATTTFSLPRNLMDARFPDDSPLHRLYPDGFTGPGDDGDWMLNAVYRQVPLLHPGVLGRSDNEGADAIKQAVEGTLGVPVDYYLLVNLAGFEKVVDAIGGVTVNINQRIPVGGNTDLGRPPDYYLEPGPHQRLDGFKALWFSRGRYGSTDYARMERQRCMVDAIIDEARPATLIRRYQALAAAGKQVVRTDLPNALLPALIDLVTLMKKHDVRSVVFTPSARFRSADPDIAWMHAVARKALRQRAATGRSTTPPRRSSASPSPAAPTATPTADPGEPSTARDSCAYDPTSGSQAQSGSTAGAATGG